MWKWLGCQGLKARASFLQTDRKPPLGLGGLLPVCRDPVANTVYVEVCMGACVCAGICVWRSGVSLGMFHRRYPLDYSSRFFVFIF